MSARHQVPKSLVAPFMNDGANVGLCRIHVPEDNKVWVEVIRRASLSVEEARILADHMNATADEVDEADYEHNPWPGDPDYEAAVNVPRTPDEVDEVES